MSPPTIAPPLGNLLICHGLNQQPHIMTQLAADLLMTGVSLHVLRLTGHGEHDSLKDLRAATARNWIDDFKNTLKNLQSEPLAVIAYSTGAAAYLCALQELKDEDPGFSEPRAHILLAPALAIRPTSRLPLVLRFLPGLTIPSASPRKCRIYFGTPVATYLELFELIKQLESLPSKALLSNPTLMAIHPHDELVNPARSRDLLQRLTNAPLKVLLLSNRFARLQPKYAHLICERQTLGDAQYEQLLQQIRITIEGMNGEYDLPNA